MRQKLSEEAEHYFYEYDRSKPILDQVLYTVDNVHLLNVRKTYTNGIYFGVYWTVLINDDQPFLAHNFQCKDRGYTEDAVDSWEKFSNVKPLTRILKYTTTLKSKKPIFVKQDIEIPKIRDRQFEVVFVYEKDSSRYSYTHLQDDASVFRGLYGSRDEGIYEQNVKEFGIAIPQNRDPTVEEVMYLWEQANISFSNAFSYVNTEYSKIKVTT
jgi:hypothetical protein